MELKYVGPKPIISHTGINFDNNKEDKYVYLNIVIQLLNAIENKQFSDHTYMYEQNTNRLSDSEIIKELTRYCPNIQELIDRENHNVDDEIFHNLQRAHENEVLNDEAKEALENNIRIMHDYLVQRSINKSVYYCAIKSLAELLKRDSISYVIVPMFQKFIHVLHSVQGVLLKQQFPIDTELEIYREDNKLLAKLKVINT